MKYCSNCGAEVDENAVVCLSCGASVKNTRLSSDMDSGSFGYAVLGFFFPIVGLILYLVWKDSKPKSASASGKGALTGVIISIGTYFLFVFLLLLVGL